MATYLAKTLYIYVHVYMFTYVCICVYETRQENGQDILTTGDRRYTSNLFPGQPNTLILLFSYLSIVPSLRPVTKRLKRMIQEIDPKNKTNDRCEERQHEN